MTSFAKWFKSSPFLLQANVDCCCIKLESHSLSYHVVIDLQMIQMCLLCAVKFLGSCPLKSDHNQPRRWPCDNQMCSSWFTLGFPMIVQWFLHITNFVCTWDTWVPLLLVFRRVSITSQWTALACLQEWSSHIQPTSPRALISNLSNLSTYTLQEQKNSVRSHNLPTQGLETAF